MEYYVGMQINWRELFDELRIPWVDRGPNVGRNRVAIQCPLCGEDDPSNHFSIDENTNAYYCLRNPSGHSGYSLNRLFHALGVDQVQQDYLLKEYGSGRRYEPPAVIEKPKTDLQKQWDRFLPASDSPACLQYLADRGFPDPERVARLYRLAFAPNGRHAGRLLIPFLEGNSLIAWTGRSLPRRPPLEPRYLAEQGGNEGVIYLPRPPRRKMILVEGPIDALKIAVAAEMREIGVAALAGLALNSSKLLRLRALAEYVEEFWMAVDASVNVSVWNRLRTELKGALPNVAIKRLSLPADYDDAGEMPIEAIQRWLSF